MPVTNRRCVNLRLLTLLVVAVDTDALRCTSPQLVRVRTRAQLVRVRSAANDGLDPESDSVGPGIYGGYVLKDENGEIVIGKQFEEHNATPGPVYAGGGYTPMSTAIRAGPEATKALLSSSPDLAAEISTGGATPLHLCCMTEQAQHSTAALLATAGEAINLEARDTWGFTALHRAASNDLALAAEALVKAGADHRSPSGREATGESARELAQRLRSFGVLRVFQQWELAQGLELPEGEFQL